MTHGICNQSVVPLKSEPAHRSEMVSQLLFGELFEVHEKQNEWLRITCAHDLYSGWLLASQGLLMDIQEFESLKKGNHVLCNELVSLLDNGNLFPIVIGSNLPMFDSEKCTIHLQHYYFKGEVINIQSPVHHSSNIIENALMYLNAPYMWGGRSPFGIDCSGLTQMVYKLSGISLKRDAALQAEQGQQIELLEEVMPADLAFFENDEGKITHVGIVMEKNKIIHASGRVRIDSLDHFGIFNNDLKKYSHKLRFIKRIL